jgi:hypothetical protein
MDRWHPPEQADILFGAVMGVYGPQNTPMLWQFIIAGALWGPYTPSTPPPKITSASLGGWKLFIWSISVECKASCGALGGYFCRRWPWLWRLWRQLYYVIWLLKISIKIIKLVVCIQCLYVVLYCKHIIIHVSLVVAWTEPKLYGGRSPNHFGPMDPGILDISRKLLSLWEQFSHCTEAKT